MNRDLLKHISVYTRPQARYSWSGSVPISRLLGSNPPGVLKWREQGLSQFHRLEGKEATESVVHGLLKVLFATKISLGSENGCMPQKELDLFDLAAVYMAQSCVRSPKIMRSQTIQRHPSGASPNHVPNNIFRDTVAPGRPLAADRSKDTTSADLGGIHPVIDCLFDPVWHRYGPNVATLADQIDNGQCPCLICMSSTSKRSARHA